MMEFYSLNPKLIMRYQPFMAKRMDKMREDTHFGGWVFGQYIGSSIGASFSKKAKYPTKPFYTMDMDNEDDSEVYVLSDVERFKMFALTFNAEHRNLKPAIIDAETVDAGSDNNTESL